MEEKPYRAKTSQVIFHGYREQNIEHRDTLYYTVMIHIRSRSPTCYQFYLLLLFLTFKLIFLPFNCYL